MGRKKTERKKACKQGLMFLKINKSYQRLFFSLEFSGWKEILNGLKPFHMDCFQAKFSVHDFHCYFFFKDM